MSLTAAIRRRLVDYASVSALVGTRVRSTQLRQSDTLPAIVYHNIGIQRNYQHDGQSTLSNGRVQVECYAANAKGAKDLAEEVRQALSGFTGQAAGVYVRSCLLENESDDFSPPTTGGESGIPRVTIDAVCTFVESVPTL